MKKAVATFRRAVRMIRRYPGYTFTQSQSQLYAWVREADPALFEEVRRRVDEGRWIVVGGMWVEPDTHIPRGEMLVRQMLVGQRWLQRHLGRRARVAWLLDSFGFSATYPQLLRKSGLEAFVTTKMMWNETTRFPGHVFWWEAPDGTRVLGYQTPDALGRTNLLRLWRAVRRFRAAGVGTHPMLLYGEGDGGMGPRPDEMLQVRFLLWLSSLGILPRMRQEGPEAWLDRVSTDGAPVIRDELYLETHRGTFTTDARGKALNRRAEETLLSAERLCSAAAWLGRPYPRAVLDDVWRTLLLNQGHDSASGTVIEASQRECHDAFGVVRALAGEELRGALQAIAARIACDRPSVAVFNTLALAREDVVVLPFTGATRVLDAAGEEVPSQVGTDLEGGTWLRFLAPSVPSLGYQTFHLPPDPVTPYLTPPAGMSMVSPDLAADLGCSWGSVRLDPHTGLVDSVRIDGREQLRAPAGVLQLFRDHPRRWEAWNIDPEALRTPLAELTEADSVALVESGPLRVVVRVRRRFGRSWLAQDVIVWRHVPRIDFDTLVDWREVRRLLKASFDVAVDAPHATFEIPYGTIQRPTRPRTEAERARFEVPHQRWLDLSADGRGVSLLNDSRYGCDVAGSRMRLSLLRAAPYPWAPVPDFVPPFLVRPRIIDHGRHRFCYALYFHEGDWREGRALEAASAFNSPLIPVHVPAQDGDLPAETSFAAVDGVGVVLESLKAAEDSDDWIVRLWETHGRPATATLRLLHPIAEAWETNLLEDVSKPLEVSGGGVGVRLDPHEVKSLKVRVSP